MRTLGSEALRREMREMKEEIARFRDESIKLAYRRTVDVNDMNRRERKWDVDGLPAERT